jgi:hypothetical protein
VSHSFQGVRERHSARKETIFLTLKIIASPTKFHCSTSDREQPKYHEHN